MKQDLIKFFWVNTSLYWVCEFSRRIYKSSCLGRKAIIVHIVCSKRETEVFWFQVKQMCFILAEKIRRATIITNITVKCAVRVCVQPNLFLFFF